MGAWHGIELSGLVLASERLTLRPWQLADAAAVFEAMQDQRMHVFLNLPSPYTREDAHAFVTQIGDEGRPDGTGLGCAVAETATGRAVGSAALRLPVAHTTAAEIGYAVYPKAQGHGYAAEAARTLAEWGIAHGVHRVQIRCAAGNLASARSALRAGFRFEALLRGAGPTAAGPVDHAVFGRLATDAGEPVRPVLPPLPGGPVGGELRDDVLALRVVEPGDAPALFDELGNAESLRWQLDDHRPSFDQVAAMAARAGLEWLVGPMGRLVMVDLASGEVAGTIALRQVGPPGVANVGYGVRPAFRGRGFTARALRLLVPWAFGQAGLARLELGAKAANIASQKVALAGGFVPDGTAAARLRNPDGTFSDEVRFALLSPRC